MNNFTTKKEFKKFALTKNNMEPYATEISSEYREEEIVLGIISPYVDYNDMEDILGTEYITERLYYQKLYDAYCIYIDDKDDEEIRSFTEWLDSENGYYEMSYYHILIDDYETQMDNLEYDYISKTKYGADIEYTGMMFGLDEIVKMIMDKGHILKSEIV